MRIVLILKGTWRTVDPPEAQVDVNLLKRAPVTICLNIEPYSYSLVYKAKTSNKARSSLKTAFQKRGRICEINMLRKMTRVELEDCLVDISP